MGDAVIPVLYDEEETVFTSFGIGALAKCTYCQVTEERNGAYELVLKYPSKGRMYPELISGMILKVRANETSGLQLFRIYRVTTPLGGIVTVYAAHISYDLSAIAVIPWSDPCISPINVFHNLFHNTATPCRFSYQTEYDTEKAFSVQKPQSVRACLGGVSGSVLDVWGGEYEWDNFTVKHHRHRGSETGVVVEYSKNLTSLDHDADASDCYTDLYPYAVMTDEDGNETVVTIPNRLITDGFINVDSHRRTLIKDFSDQFEFGTTITPDALRTKAEAWLESNPLGRSEAVITVAFEPLRNRPGYSDVLEHVSLCDVVTIRHAELGIAVKTKVIKTVYDTLAEKYVSVSLGKARQSLISSVNSLELKTAHIIRTIFRLPGIVMPILHEMGGRIDDICSRRMYRLVISSSNGNIFKNSDISTVLSATVFSWDDDVTDELDPNQFIWTRVSDDHEADAQWNHDHYGGTKSITVTSDDVTRRATFFCDLIDTTTRQSLLG
nr:MAG TPA: tail protein [Caudoviricetes sp.]